MNNTNLDKGIATIRKYSKLLPTKSGIYKMISSNNEILYIGKAKNLNKRVRTYTNPLKLNYRLQDTCELDYKLCGITRMVSVFFEKALKCVC